LSRPYRTQSINKTDPTGLPLGIFVRHGFHEPEHLLQCRGIDAMGLVLSYNIRHARYRWGIE